MLISGLPLTILLACFVTTISVDSPSDEQPIICTLCNIMISYIIFLYKMEITEETILEQFNYICKSLKLGTNKECEGTLKIYLETFLYILTLKKNVSLNFSERFCSGLYQSHDCPLGENFNWSIHIPSGNSNEETVVSDNETFKILHIADIHFDPLYTPGKTRQCGELLCCQNDQENATFPDKGCGPFSEYRKADTSRYLLEETLKQANTQAFHYVYFTGDIMSQRMFNISVKNNKKVITEVNNYLRRFNVRVFPCLGNHETMPANFWAPLHGIDEKFQTNWLFELIAEQWSMMIGENVEETVMKGGFYSVNPRPGFRVICINSNVAFYYNAWLLYDDYDPYGQLQWLVDTLKMAEDHNEKVHILSHIPPGDYECLKVWAREYSKIIKRFAHIITGQFFGHTHTDEFYVFFNNSRVINVGFNGGSLTPFSVQSNPSFKYYDVGVNSFTLKNFEEWTFNLTLANSRNFIEWYKLYNFCEFYGVQNLTPPEIGKLVNQMAKNYTLIEYYHKFMFRNSDEEEPCKESCLTNTLCNIVTTVYGENEHCQRYLLLSQL